jgi:cell division protein FtsN
VPRVVVPKESEERVAGHSQRRRKVVSTVLLLAVFLAAAAFGVKTWRERMQHVSADTVFVSAPAWPKSEPRQATPKAPQANKEFLLVVGAYADQKEAAALAGRLTGLGRPVSIVVPVSATDSLNKVIVSGFDDRAVARRVADSLSTALRVRVTIIEPTGTRTQ